jgi:hypothetical protein
MIFDVGANDFVTTAALFPVLLLMVRAAIEDFLAVATALEILRGKDRRP